VVDLIAVAVVSIFFRLNSGFRIAGLRRAANSRRAALALPDSRPTLSFGRLTVAERRLSANHCRPSPCRSAAGWRDCACNLNDFEASRGASVRAACIAAPPIAADGRQRRAQRVRCARGYFELSKIDDRLPACGISLRQCSRAARVNPLAGPALHREGAWTASNPSVCPGLHFTLREVLA
jgi:hypothetical protein